MNTRVGSVCVSGAVRRQHVARKSVVIRNRHMRRVFLFLFLAATLALSYVWTRVQVIQQGYEISRLHKSVAGLEHDAAQLQAEIARLKSPDRLELIARTYFEMRSPKANEIFFVGGE